MLDWLGIRDRSRILIERVAWELFVSLYPSRYLNMCPNRSIFLLLYNDLFVLLFETSFFVLKICGKDISRQNLNRTMEQPTYICDMSSVACV